MVLAAPEAARDTHGPVPVGNARSTLGVRRRRRRRRRREAVGETPGVDGVRALALEGQGQQGGGGSRSISCTRRAIQGGKARQSRSSGVDRGVGVEERTCGESAGARGKRCVPTSLLALQQQLWMWLLEMMLILGRGCHVWPGDPCGRGRSISLSIAQWELMGPGSNAYHPVTVPVELNRIALWIRTFGVSAIQ
ncbi:hypothetical protein BD779DRAFT_1507983 [Infundibulicybe gibba]|nr:hypothetical protein BD779DRAFT_1507983 [Infundibulicybe gibba]